MNKSEGKSKKLRIWEDFRLHKMTTYSLVKKYKLSSNTISQIVNRMDRKLEKKLNKFKKEIS